MKYHEKFSVFLNILVEGKAKHVKVIAFANTKVCLRVLLPSV
jgi:hypothetical protein